MAITCEEPDKMLAQPDVEQHWGKVQISQNMKRYFLVPPDDRNWLAPSELQSNFGMSSRSLTSTLNQREKLIWDSAPHNYFTCKAKWKPDLNLLIAEENFCVLGVA